MTIRIPARGASTGRWSCHDPYHGDGDGDGDGDEDGYVLEDRRKKVEDSKIKDRRQKSKDRKQKTEKRKEKREKRSQVVLATYFPASLYVDGYMKMKMT